MKTLSQIKRESLQKHVANTTAQTPMGQLEKNFYVARSGLTGVSLKGQEINFLRYIIQTNGGVPNASFEVDTPGNGVVPTGWTDYSTTAPDTYKGVANDFSNLGLQSYKLQSNTTLADAGIKIQVTCNSTDSVVLSAFVKTDSNVTNANLVLGTDIGGGGTNVANNVGASNNSRVSVSKSGGFNLGYAAIFIGLGSFGGASKGTVWYDNIQLSINGKPQPIGNFTADLLKQALAVLSLPVSSVAQQNWKTLWQNI